MTINYNQIVQELYVGTVPRLIQDVELLKRECAISAVLNLQTDEDMLWYNVDWPSIQQYYNSCQIQAWRTPVRDFDPEDLKNKVWHCAATLDSIIRAGHRTYLHCTAGINRSPTVAIAYLYRYRGYDLNTAIKMMLDCRSCDPCMDALKIG
ncbi:MAG: dual specificity protein phosphatase family protein [Acidobacteriota bacterium]